MKECQDCEYRGYSPQFCAVHVKHCRKNNGKKSKPLPSSVKVGAKALAGVGLGMGLVVFSSAAVSLVGGAALLHAALIKIGAGAGITGGGIGLYKGLKEHMSEEKTEE